MDAVFAKALGEESLEKASLVKFKNELLAGSIRCGLAICYPHHPQPTAKSAGLAWRRQATCARFFEKKIYVQYNNIKFTIQIKN